MIRGRGVHGFLLLLTVNTRQPPWGREGPGVKKVKGTKRNISKKKLGRKLRLQQSLVGNVAYAAGQQLSTDR